ncbi:MAG: LEA type 2 family protein [Deltaproteobacteria bacterium]|nr:LEA type 2 family protein [Deltaproteobacteria bacterium]
MLLRVIAIAILILTSGCGIMRHGDTPNISLVDIQFSDITLFETSADIVVRIENPNPFPIEIDGASHDLYINGIEIGTGLSDQELEIPRLSSAIQKVKLRLSNLTVIRNIQDLVDKRDFDYRIESTLYAPNALGLGSYTVSRKGRFSTS